MNVQIDMHLFLQLWTYFFERKESLSRDERLMFEELDAKAEKIIARELYSRYKRAATEEERNAARLEYMQHISSVR